MLLPHFMRAAASRTFCTAGSSRPMRMAMMAMTTSSSISVKAFRRDITPPSRIEVRRTKHHDRCSSGTGAETIGGNVLDYRWGHGNRRLLAEQDNSWFVTEGTARRFERGRDASV